VSEAEGKFLDALYQGVSDSGQLTLALELIQNMFGCRSAVLVMVDARDPTASFVETSGTLHQSLQLYVEKYAQIDPAPARFLSLPAGRAMSTDRLFTPEERATGQFYNEFFKPIGLIETLGGPLYSSDGNFAMIALMRGDDRPPFDEWETAYLEQLMPHITRALHLRRTFFRIDSKNVGLQATLDRLQAGLMLLAADGEALFANAAMQTLAKHNDGLVLDRNGRPLIIHMEARRRFDALLTNVSAGGAGGIVAAPRTGGRDYIVLVAPSPASSAQSDWERNGPRGAIMVVHDPDSGSANTSEILEQGLGLSKGAARLVAALAADHDLKTFAESEGVTIHTARFHLRSALSRTGAKTQAEVVRIAVRLLRDFALAEPNPASPAS
jgi:GAF domain-containing protein/DNA-binding CsgD family transcriptional regulator